MKKFIGLMILIVIMMFNVSFASVTIPDDIRIGLFFGAKAAKTFTISSKTGMQIGLVDDDENFELLKEIPSNKEVTISRGSTSNSVNIEGVGEVGDLKNFVRIIPNDSKDVALLTVNDNNYRGEIEVRRYSSSDMTVINVLNMQDYLYGVVPREIGGNSPIEAVKAQAIIARTYAAKNYTKRNVWGFNLTNTVDDQAYGGYDWETKNSNMAVDETEDMVATYNGELIGGYYFSTSGGYTESSANVWGGEVDYLEAVPDPYEPDNLAKTTWTVTYSASEIKTLLANKGVDIGDITNMIVNEFTDAGRVLELEIIGTKGTYTLNKSAARTYLNLNSQWFTINDDEPVVPEYKNYKDNITIDEKIDLSEEENSETKPLLAKLLALLTVEKSKKETASTEKSDVTKIRKDYAARTKVVDTFEIKGRGWGHSVGMSQNGAIGMANNDFTCEEIIKWYYQGVEVE